MATPAATDDTKPTAAAAFNDASPDGTEIGPDGRPVPKRKPQQGFDVSDLQNSDFGQIILFFLALLQMLTGKNPLVSAMQESAFDRTKGDGSVHINRKPRSGGQISLDSSGNVSLKDFDKSEKFPTDIEFTSAKRVGNDIVYFGKNGEEVVKHRPSTTETSRSWANNNPGNIEYGTFAKNHGAIGTDGRFAVFPSVEAGFDAQASLLKSGRYKDLTLAQAIAKYAPPHENDTQAYVNYVSQRSGISANTRLGDLAMPDLLKITYAMAKHEGWKEGQILAKGLDDGRAGIPDQGFQAPGGPLTIGLPLDSKITSDFGHRDTGIAGASTNHRGIDMRASVGTPLLAQGPVQVAYAGPSSGYGNVAILNHGQGVFTVYGHIESDGLAKTGTVLQKGQQFAKSGDEGIGAAHLHYEILLQGKDGRVYNVDPEKAIGQNLSDPKIREALIADAGNKASRVFAARVSDDLKGNPVQLVAQRQQQQTPPTPAAPSAPAEQPKTPTQPPVVAAKTPDAPAAKPEAPKATPPAVAAKPGEATSVANTVAALVFGEKQAATVRGWFAKAVDAASKPAGTEEKPAATVTAEAPKPATEGPDKTASTTTPAARKPDEETPPAVVVAKGVSAPAPAPA